MAVDGLRGSRWWHTTIPHSLPSRMSEIANVAVTPMFCMYSMWAGEMLRVLHNVISSVGSPTNAGSTRIGTGS